VATISRLFKIVGFLCKRALEKRLYSAKEAHICKEPTNKKRRENGRKTAGKRQECELISVARGWSNHGTGELVPHQYR